MESGELHIDGFTSIENFTLNHPKIAKKDVIIENARFDYRFLLVTRFHFYRQHFLCTIESHQSKTVCRVQHQRRYDLQAESGHSQNESAGFHHLFTQGLFTNFEGMEAEGGILSINSISNTTKTNRTNWFLTVKSTKKTCVLPNTALPI